MISVGARGKLPLVAMLLERTLGGIFLHVNIFYHLSNFYHTNILY